MRAILLLLLSMICATSTLAQEPATRPRPDRSRPHAHHRAPGKVPGEQLFEEIARQAGVAQLREAFSVGDDRMFVDQFNRPPLKDAVFSADFDHLPYFKAIGEACEATGLSPVINWNGAWRSSAARGPIITPVLKPSAPPMFVDGPVLILVNSIEREAIVRYADTDAKTADEDTLRVTLHVIVEPKFRQFWFAREVNVTRADDESGHSLLRPATTQPATRPSLLQPAAVMVHVVPITLHSPRGVGGGDHKIAKLEGTIELSVPRQIVSADYPLAKSPKTQPLGDDELELSTVKLDAPIPIIEMRLHRGKEPLKQWLENRQRFIDFAQTFALVGGPGTPRYSGGDAKADGEDAAIARLHFNRRKPPANAAPAPIQAMTLRITWPSEMQTLPAKFKFEGIPLP